MAPASTILEKHNGIGEDPRTVKLPSWVSFVLDLLLQVGSSGTHSQVRRGYKIARV